MTHENARIGREVDFHFVSIDKAQAHVRFRHYARVKSHRSLLMQVVIGEAD